MSFLKEIFHSENANQKVKEYAKSMNIDILVGDNFNWLNDEDENLKEEGVFLNENFITFLEEKGIECSDIIKEDFRNTREGEDIEVYLKDESGVYYATMVTEYYDIDGVSNFGEWIDFNNLIYCMENFSS